MLISALASREIRFLDEREPIKRTRTAYVDMYTRELAKRASRFIGHIFGLLVDINLAVDSVD